MLITKKYCIAEHLVDVVIDSESDLWDAMIKQYAPFEVSEGGESGAPLFCFEERPTISLGDDAPVLVVNEDDPEFPHMEIYNTADGGFLFNIIDHACGESYCRLVVNPTEGRAEFALRGSLPLRFNGFNLAFNLTYIIMTATLGTVLLHASTVVTQGKAYVFLGKSGTGKSTHSRMWLSVLGEDGVLMNDDHPIVRVKDDGVVAYGSPWSGQTPCYKNMCAPLGAIVRIVQAPENKMNKLSAVESYGSLMTSCSGMSWVKSLSDGRAQTLQGVITKVPCYRLSCLPNEAAAQTAMTELNVKY